MKFSNKNIILTGATSGIGQKLLEAISKCEGVKIIAVGRSIEKISQVTNKVFPFSADISKVEEVDKLFDYAKDIFGEIDIFIANAGFAYIEELKTPDWKHIENIYSVNNTSIIYSLLKFNEQSSKKAKQFVCTLSAVAFVPLHAYSLYCSSKAALHQFIEAYRCEKKENLTITAIYPVATKTSFFDHASGKSSTPAPWPTQDVDKVVTKIINGIEKNKKKVYPSFLFSLFFPIGRAFPIFLKIYTLLEKRKTERWLKA